MALDTKMDTSEHAHVKMSLPFIHSFNRYLLSTKVLGTVFTKRDKTDKVSLFLEELTNQSLNK